MSVALVKPVFTSTPYSEYRWGSFYAFYHKYASSSGNITTDLGMLKTSVALGLNYASGWGHSYPFYLFFRSQAARNCGLVLGKNVRIISDINVSQGALFAPSGARNFDVAVIEHQEYVTQSEYDQLRQFVASGGRLIAMSANEMYVRINYDSATMQETFVSGHGYAYNGLSAWHAPQRPFPVNTSSWFGSTYCCFHDFHYEGGIANGGNPVGALLVEYYKGVLAPTYGFHEENSVTNFTGTSVVATFLRLPGVDVSSYAHAYGKGAVFCLCVFGEDVIEKDNSTQFFLVASVTAPIPTGGPHQGLSAVIPSNLPDQIVTGARSPFRVAPAAVCPLQPEKPAADA